MMSTDAVAVLRRLMLALLLFGMAGTLAELLLLEHTESRTQLVPIAMLALGLAAALAAAVIARRWSLLALRTAMLALLAGGIIGVIMHYRGNVEFELEMYPGLRGFGLFREALQGATPALAPGALVQLGLLGLLCTWHHPRLRPERPAVPPRSN
jgi:hypothetical protein